MQTFRKFLFPFALLYGAMTWIRNQLYNSKVLTSTSWNLPVICVGNLNAGGTGKSPMIEYLLSLLTGKRKVATLSRGYKRSSKGFRLLRGTEAAREVGDEPLQFKNKFPQALVAVDADRRNGIGRLLEKDPEVILLDDAFQHRKVKAGFNILLTAYGDLYTDDFMLPTGNLREPTVGAERAQAVVVTKCPMNLSLGEKERISRKLKLRNYQHLFFAGIDYNKLPIGENGEADWSIFKDNNIAVVTGIANPVPFVNHLQGLKLNFRHLKFPDHHNFSEKDLENLKKEKIILTTEKDYMRLKDQIPADKLFYLPIQVTFLWDSAKFDALVESYIKENEV